MCAACILRLYISCYTDCVLLFLKVITFIDLAGHEKYLKTTVFGMTGHLPDFCMLMVRGIVALYIWRYCNISRTVLYYVN